MKLFDYDGDEALFTIAAGVAMLVGAYRWYVPLWLKPGFARPRVGLLALTPVAGLAGLLFVLCTWADPNYVVGHVDYIFTFMLGGAAWILWTPFFLRLMGIDLRDDAAERNNPAAQAAIAGGALAAIVIYAGGNVGAGPTIWTTIVPALAGTAVFFVLWLIVELFTRVSEQIAIDRDEAAGVRQAGFAIAAGLVLARSIAGDWTSWNETFEGLLNLGWPALALTVAVIPLHIAFRPTALMSRRGVLAAGLVPALVFVLAAVAYVIYLGPADIGKHVITYEQYMHQN